MLKQVIIAAVVLVSLVLTVSVYRMNNTAQIMPGMEDTDSEYVSAPDQAQPPDLRLISIDAPRTTSESAASDFSTDLEAFVKYSAMVRSEIHRSPTLPVGVSFKTTLGLLDTLNKENPAFALYHLQYEMGFDETDDAELSQDLLYRMLEALQTIESEIKQENRRLGCTLGVPSAAGNQVYPILEAMNDTPEIVAKKHLDLLNIELEKDTAARLQRWLNDQKTNITQVKYNYKEYYEATGKSADARLASICNEATEEI